MTIRFICEHNNNDENQLNNHNTFCLWKSHNKCVQDIVNDANKIGKEDNVFGSLKITKVYQDGHKIKEKNVDLIQNKTQSEGNSLEFKNVYNEAAEKNKTRNQHIIKEIRNKK